MTENKGQRVIVVLGMHRGGTSAVTRALDVLGVELGDRLMPPVPENNEKGFWEDLDVYALNNDLLRALGHDWHTLAPMLPEEIGMAPLITAEFKLRAVELLRDRLSAASCFGLKDPRMPRLLPFWQEVFAHLHARESYIIVCRNPMSVARSLAKRDGFDLPKAYFLWLEHMYSSVVQTMDHAPVVVDYDRLMDDPAREMQRIAQGLGLVFDPGGAAFAEYRTRFLEDSLRHSRYSVEDLQLDKDVPPGAIALYGALMELATDAVRFGDDRVRTLIEGIGEQLRENRVALRFMRVCDEKVSALARRLAELDERIAALAQAVAERDGQIACLNQKAAEQDRHVADQDRHIAGLDQAVAERDRQIAELSREVAERDRQITSLAQTLQDIYDSNVWRFLAPLRWYGRQRQRARRLVGALPALVSRTGGVLPLARIIAEVWKREGLAGVKSLAALYLRNKADTRDSAGVARSAAQSEQNVERENSRPEILFVSHDASRTGAPVFLLHLIPLLASRLDLNFVILLCGGGEMEAEFRALGTTLVSSGRHELDPLVSHALKRRNIRLVYSNTITNGQIQRRLKELLGVPIICHVHELAFSIERLFGAENLKRVLETTDLFLAGSKVVAAYLRDRQQLADDKVAVAYPFVDVERNRSAAARKPLDLPGDAVVVGACGTIGWRKGTDLYVQIARLVLERTRRRVVFVWVGGPLSHGEYRSLQYDATVMGIDTHLRFTGAVESHLAYLAQFDVFVLPSREDPFPLVMLDAMSLDVPVVCFEGAGGAPELVEDDAGRVVPYLNLDQMAAAVVALVEDEALRRQLGERARAKVLARHDVTVGAKHIANLVVPYVQRA